MKDVNMYLEQMHQLETKHRKATNLIAKREIMRQIKELELKINKK